MLTKEEDALGTTRALQNCDGLPWGHFLSPKWPVCQQNQESGTCNSQSFLDDTLHGHGWTHTWGRVRAWYPLDFTAHWWKGNWSPAASTANPYYHICSLQKLTQPGTFGRWRSSRILPFLPTEGMCFKQTAKEENGKWEEECNTVAL